MSGCLEVLEDTPVVVVDEGDLRCESPRACVVPAVARFVVLCPCRKMRLGCAWHIKLTVSRFENCRLVCNTCGMVRPDYRVVPL